MPLKTSLLILLKIHLVTIALFFIVSFLYFVFTNNGKEFSLPLPALVFALYYTVVYLLIGVPAFYILGLAIHRIFLSKSLFSQLYTILLAIILSGAIKLYVINSKANLPDINFITNICVVFIFISCELMRHFTLQELKNNRKNS